MTAAGDGDGKTRIVQRPRPNAAPPIKKSGSSCGPKTQLEPAKPAPINPSPQAQAQAQPEAGDDGEGRTKIIVAGGGQAAAPCAPKCKPCAPERAARQEPDSDEPVVGWLVVVEGPGVGKFRAVFEGMNSLGRNRTGNRVSIDFGDDSISRDQHAFVTYDGEDRKFYVSHGGKANIVRLNGQTLLEAKPLNPGDQLKIGQTSLRFVPFCGTDFDWRDLAE